MDIAPLRLDTQVPPRSDEEIGAIVAHWDRLRGTLRLPKSDTIDPLELKPFLSRIFIIDGSAIDEMQLRLAGTSYRDLYGFEITSKKLTELIPATQRPDLLEDYESCLARAAPVYHSGSMTWRANGGQVRYERVLLPFGEARQVNRILGFAVFFDSNDRKILR